MSIQQQVTKVTSKTLAIFQQIIVRTIGPIVAAFGWGEAEDVDAINELVVQLLGVIVTIATNIDVIIATVKAIGALFVKIFKRKDVTP